MTHVTAARKTGQGLTDFEKQAIARLYLNNPKRPFSEIARAVGVDQRTVSKFIKHTPYSALEHLSRAHIQQEEKSEFAVALPITHRNASMREPLVWNWEPPYR